MEHKLFNAQQPLYEVDDIVLGTHVLHRHPMFDDDGIAKVFDLLGEDLVINIMGTNPEDSSDWAYLQRNGATGEELLEAVSNGKIWCNAVRAHLVDDNYATLARIFHGEVDPDGASGSSVSKVVTNLLASSPGAQVYYHSDPEWNFLLQLRGTKRIYIYPSDIEEIAPVALVEAIYAGQEEELPFKLEFDEYATVIELEPGDFVAWPLNGPHRVVNVSGMNVSVAISYQSPSSIKRERISRTNDYLRRTWGVKHLKSKTSGPGQALKVNLVRVLSKLRKPTPPDVLREKPREYVVDLTTPLGYSQDSELVSS